MKEEFARQRTEKLLQQEMARQEAAHTEHLKMALQVSTLVHSTILELSSLRDVVVVVVVVTISGFVEVVRAATVRQT